MFNFLFFLIKINIIKNKFIFQQRKLKTRHTGGPKMNLHIYKQGPVCHGTVFKYASFSFPENYNVIELLAIPYKTGKLVL